MKNANLKFAYLAGFIMTLVILLVLWDSRRPQGVQAQSGPACSNPETGTDITIDDTVGGIAVLSPSLIRCTALIKNNGGQTIRCGQAGDTIDAATGLELLALETLSIGPIDGVTAGWNCIRTGASNSTVSVFQSFQ